MYAKVSDVVKGSKLFGLAIVSDHAKGTFDEAAGVPPRNVIIAYGVHGDPILDVTTNKLTLGLGPVDGDATKATVAKLDVVDGFVQFYYSDYREAEEARAMSEFAAKRAFAKGLADGRREGVWANGADLKEGDELFFIEKQPGELSHPIGLAEEFVPVAPSLHIGKWTIVSINQTVVETLDLDVAPRESEHVHRTYRVKMDKDDNLRHFFRSAEVAHQHLETLLHSQLHGIG